MKVMFTSWAQFFKFSAAFLVTVILITLLQAYFIKKK